MSKLEIADTQTDQRCIIGNLNIMTWQIKILTESDVGEFDQLVNVFREVFEMETLPAPEKDLKKLLRNKDFLALVAKSGEKVVGGLTVYILHSYYLSKPAAYIYDVGVLTEYQRRGVGRQLISYLITYCQNHGFQCAYVEAEATDVDAVEFYRATPYNSEQEAIHFTYLFDGDQHSSSSAVSSKKDKS